MVQRHFCNQQTGILTVPLHKDDPQFMFMCKGKPFTHYHCKISGSKYIQCQPQISSQISLAENKKLTVISYRLQVMQNHASFQIQQFVLSQRVKPTVLYTKVNL